MNNRIISFFTIFVLLIISCTNKVTEPTINYTLITNVNPLDAGIINPSDTTIFEEGSKVTLEAISNQHWLFDKWTEDLQGNENPTEILMDRSKTIIANFTKVRHPLIINIEGEGIVNEQIVLSKTNDYDYGTTVQLTALADSGWVFDHWDGDAIGGDNPIQVLIDTNKTVTANFIQIFTLEIDITGNGLVQIVPDLSVYPVDSVVELTAIADSGWVFDSWDGNLIGNDNPIQILIDTNKTITANFIKVQYPLIINIEGEGIVEEQIVISKTNDYDYGTIVQLTAIADSGWIFDHWDGDAIGGDNPIQVLIDTNKIVTATFIQTFTINLNITGNGSVQLEPDLAAYPVNFVVQMTALPDNGWIFTRWTGDVQDSSEVINIQIDNDKTINVIFNEIILPQTTWKFWDGAQQVFTNEFGWLNPEFLFVRVEVNATPYQVSKLNYQNWQFGNWSNWQEIIATQALSIAEFDIDISDYEGEGKVQFDALNNYNMLSYSTQVNYKYDHTIPIFNITAGEASAGFGEIALFWTNNEVSDALSGIGYILIYRNITDSFLGAVEVGRIHIVSQSIIPSSFYDGSMPYDDNTTKYFYWGLAVDRAGNKSEEQRIDNAEYGTSIILLVPADV